jgi:CBS domain-containing protein
MKQAVIADQNSTIKEVAAILHKRHVGSVVLVDQRHKCLGICTERDIIRGIAHGIPVTAPVKRIMTPRPVTVSQGDTLQKARSILSRRRIRHLPVVDDRRRLVGMITARGLLEDFLGVSS